MPKRKSGGITVFLADDNLIVREGVRALLNRQRDVDVVGVAADYQELVDGAIAARPQVIVTDIRMPPTLQREGIDAAKEVRKHHPGIGVVVLSQYDDPEYAVSLLAEGSAGYAYLLKDRVGEGDQLTLAIKIVAAGGTFLEPQIQDALVRPVSAGSDLSPADEEILRLVAEGRTIKAIAAARRTTPAAAAADVEKLFLTIAQSASAGTEGSLRRLRMLHQAIVDREEQGETLSRMLPGGIAEKLRREGRRIGETETLEVTVLMSDIRGYTTLAEQADPTRLAHQLNDHRAEMSRAILDSAGTVMQFVGDAVMAVFGAPVSQPDHADRALEAAVAMHRYQDEVNRRWGDEGLPPFHIGIGLSTGTVAAALLGSEERIEYTVVGDTVNLTQRLQQLASGGQIVLSDKTRQALSRSVGGTETLHEEVKGRARPVVAHRMTAAAG
ncbi:MAG: response regulator [Actinobacteria bacterium]|nr:response regulator [Actinomycetota bacterium]